MFQPPSPSKPKSFGGFSLKPKPKAKNGSQGVTRHTLKADKQTQPSKSVLDVFGEPEEDENAGLTPQEIFKKIQTECAVKDKVLEKKLSEMRAEGVFNYDEGIAGGEEGEEEEPLLSDDEASELTKKAHVDLRKPGLVILKKPEKVGGKGPRYIDSMVNASKLREFERDVVEMRTLKKEREKEKAEGVQEGEVFVTGAYKKHLEERESMKRFLEQEEKDEQNPALQSTSVDFNRNMLESNMMTRSRGEGVKRLRKE